MNNSIERLIDGMVASLRQEIIPQVCTGFARGQAFGLIYMLNSLRLRAEWSREFVLEQIRPQVELAGKLAPLLADTAPALPKAPTPELDLHALEALRDTNDARICSLIDWTAAKAAIGLSENAFHVLCLLLAAEDRQLSPSDLSDLVGTSRANMTKIIESLAVSGYASRREVKHDGRRQVIAITKSGKAAALAALPTLSRPLKMACSSLTAEEMAQLDALLRKVVVSFDNGALELDATTIFGNPAKEDGHG